MPATPTDQDRERALQFTRDHYYCNAATEGCVGVKCMGYGGCQTLQEKLLLSWADERARVLEKVEKAIDAIRPRSDMDSTAQIACYDTTYDTTNEAKRVVRSLKAPEQPGEWDFAKLLYYGECNECASLAAWPGQETEFSCVREGRCPKVAIEPGDKGGS